MHQTGYGKKKPIDGQMFFQKFGERLGGIKPGLISGAVIIVVLIAIFLAVVVGDKTSDTRSETYKKVSGSAAGLDATIIYNCKSNCDHKFDFNVYILAESGQQVSVVRPQKDGRVRLALPEGNYVMLVGRQLGPKKVFPQEKIALKNGQRLDLKLQYEEKL